MRTSAVLASAITRIFPAASLRATLLKQAALLGAAVLWVWLLSMTSGLDLSPGFF